MKDAQKPDHLSLNALVSRLKEGRFVIPDFQREFEWMPGDIRDLIRSIFLDYYIGSLLLWKGQGDNFAALSCEPLYGFGNGGSPEYIVLDGQQRLTALYYVFMAPKVPLPSRTRRAMYYIRVDRFMEEALDDAFEYNWITKKRSNYLKDRQAQYADHVFPLSVVGEGGWELGNWVQGYESFWRKNAEEDETSGESVRAKVASKHAGNAKLFGEHLKEITDHYQISYIELDRDIGVEKVCDIFTQINSKGVRLDVFDLINAMLRPMDIGLKDMWREAQGRLTFAESGRMNVYILQVMSILIQAYCSPKYLYYLLPGQNKQVRDPDGTLRKEVLMPNTEAFKERWNVAVSALENAIKLLSHPQEYGAISSKYLPYVSILPVFAALQCKLKTIPAPKQLDGQRKLRHWYWASVFTNRYSGSVESTSARDYLDVNAWLDDDAAEPSLLLEFKQRFASLDLRKETKSGTSVYNGIFNLLVLKGARDWMTGTVPQHGDLDDHHIVPTSWGTQHLKSGVINTILNRTPLSRDTNQKVIGNRPPNMYLPELIAESGEVQVRAILESHFISPAAQEILLREPFTSADYEAFISERQRTLTQAIESLLVKERLGLPPHLRELDEKIEQVELALRTLIEGVMKNNSANLPANLLDNAEERIQRAVRKNAALDAEKFDTLAGKLEFCDLRELQEMIVAKALWPIFEANFANKLMLVGKFDQLAELRNGIRHSRSVDEITQKEGEAAILWFGGVLKL